jgi:hypothetical protein
MRITTLFLAATALLAAACGKKTESNPEPAKPGPDKIIAPVKTEAPKLACDTVLPAAVRDKYFAGMTLASSPAVKTAAGLTLNCVFQKGTETQMVQVVCNHVADDIVSEILGNLKRSMHDVNDVPGVGKEAYEGVQDGKRILRFHDDDTSCYGSILSSPSAADVAKALVASLTPDLLK